MRLAISIAIILLLIQNFSTANPTSDDFFTFGQFRTGYYGTYNHSANINKDDIHEWRIRARLGAGYHFSENISFRVRLAGRFSTEQNRLLFWFDDHLPARSGIRLGESTIDVIELRWRASEKLMIHAGRFQSNYSLKSFVTKGLHRYDNPNTLISWTDGILLKWSFLQNWNLEYTAEFNSKNGPGSISHNPLTFDEDASRFSHTVVFVDTNLPGYWKQREIGFHIIPSSLPIENDFEHYIAISGRVIHKIPGLDLFGADYSAGLEVGFAPFTTINPELNNRDNAFAWQTSISARNVLEKNNFGILYGYADPGWLISPSFRQNSRTWEVRYQRILKENLTAEIRYRYRTDPFVADGAFSRQDGDIWARMTYRF